MSEKNKHLSDDDRFEIEWGLKANKSFKQIGELINKDCTTISKEIRNHIKCENSGAIGRKFNDCINRYNCPYSNNHYKYNCADNCNYYKKESCKLLDKPPYICNGCNKKHSCTLSKKLYKAK